MNKSYTIYFSNKPFYIVSQLSAELQKLANTAGTLIGNQPDAGLIAQTIQDMDLPGTKAVIILTDDVKQYWQEFKKHFKKVKAGGGIVYNENREVLFIYRRGKWDLPKGKLDDGETIDACAMREVMEETGLQKLDFGALVGKTYHTYVEKGRHILKTTVWFSMFAPGEQVLIPQQEEDIEEMKWVGRGKWGAVFQKTYPSVPLILQQFTSAQ